MYSSEVVFKSKKDLIFDKIIFNSEKSYNIIVETMPKMKIIIRKVWHLTIEHRHVREMQIGS